MSTTLPPTLSEQALSAALDEFTAALGSARVLTGDADLKLYRDPFQHASSDDFTASAVLMPETRRGDPGDRAHRQPSRRAAVDASPGRNNGYGGPAPRVAAR